MKTLYRALGVALAVTLPLAAQSLKYNDPTALAAGVNRGTVDSFVGDQFWYFYATPGRFQLTFSGSSPQEGFTIGGRVNAGIGFLPKTPGAAFTQRTLANGSIVFSGSVTQRTRVGILVEKPNSALVRQTVAYTLVGSGSIEFATGAAAAPNVTGVYSVSGGFVGDYGVMKLTADGQIVTSNGQRGSWQLFDADSRTYVFVLPQDRRTLIFQPGRGFVDAHNGNLALQAKH